MEINVSEVMELGTTTEATFFKKAKVEEKKVTNNDVGKAFERMGQLREALCRVQSIVNSVNYDNTEESWRNAYDSIYKAFRWAYEEEKSIVAQAECTPSKWY